MVESVGLSPEKNEAAQLPPHWFDSEEDAIREAERMREEIAGDGPMTENAEVNVYRETDESSQLFSKFYVSHHDGVRESVANTTGTFEQVWPER